MWYVLLCYGAFSSVLPTGRLDTFGVSQPRKRETRRAGKRNPYPQVDYASVAFQFSSSPFLFLPKSISDLPWIARAVSSFWPWKRRAAARSATRDVRPIAIRWRPPLDADTPTSRIEASRTRKEACPDILWNARINHHIILPKRTGVRRTWNYYGETILEFVFFLSYSRCKVNVPLNRNCLVDVLH